MKKKLQFCLLIILVNFHFGFCDNKKNSIVRTENSDVNNFENVGRQIIEQGRTFVHHATKRFMIILPAIFFKLGIAFTLLILVTLVAVNNGVIGFLLLVVGLSSVLARLQESRRPPSAIPVPYFAAPQALPHHHIWDRSDSVSDTINSNAKLAYNGYVGQNGQQLQYSHPELTNYYSKYTVNKA